MREPRETPVAAIGRVAEVLSFPALLLVLIVAFVAVQQHADRRDPKLASAPVGRREETIGFR